MSGAPRRPRSAPRATLGPVPAGATRAVGTLPGIAAFAVMPDGQTWTTGKG